MNTTVKIGSFELKNPVTLASGTCGYGEELSSYFDLSKLGAIFTKGLSLNPREGNKGNRILETPSGVMNSIGLENVGIEKFMTEKLPFLIEKKIVPIPNVAGHSIDENVEMVKILSSSDYIEAMELNVSCPNVKEGGISFGSDIKKMCELVSAVRKATNKALIVKLSPNVGNIADFAQAAEEEGADAVSAVNTFLGMKIDLKTRRPYFKNKVAGVSGPAIRPMAVRAVYEIFSRVKIPIVGLGGIATLEDSLEFIFAGATAISIGTMNFVEPSISDKIVTGLEKYLAENSFNDINALIGISHKE